MVQRETAGDLLYILLRITTINAERVQLQQFARVVFIKTAIDTGRLVPSGGIRTRHARSPVVEIEKHRRRMRRGAEQVAETAQGEGTNRFAIECSQQVSIVIFIGKDAEMVLPKIDHHFKQLLFAVNGAQQLRTLQLSHNHLRVLRRRGRPG